MLASKHAIYPNPRKSPYNFEKCDSKLEYLMMEKLDSDPAVTRWMKRHGITIQWIDVQKHRRRYVPDFIVEYVDGHKCILEVKDPSRMDSDEVKRKRKAAEMWCKRRGLEYIVATVD